MIGEKTPGIRPKEHERHGGQEFTSMPTISEFFGILIRMYYDDHNPPHFHAYYGEHEILIIIETLATLEGSLPRRAKTLVVEWALEHRQELLNDWALATQHQPLKKISPLE